MRTREDPLDALRHPEPEHAALSQMDTQEGTLLLGRYRIVRRLANGGMGVIYLARVEGAEGFVKPVVIKRILPGLVNTPSYISSFIQEAQVLASLHDPGIANVIDFANTDTGYLMVLEYVHGFEVKEWMSFLRQNGERIPCDIVITIIISVLTTLQQVHGLRREKSRFPQIVHRDISPSNVMIDVEGRIKLVDFGIAMISPTMTQHEIEPDSEIPFFGKMPYGAPELFRGRRPSASSDIFACGVTLHELLTGQNEFIMADPSSTIGRVMTHQLTPIADRCAKVPDGIDEIIATATHKSADQRFPTAGVFAEALRSILPFQEHTAKDRLAMMAARDFQSEEMIRFLDVPSLEEREWAWRTSPGREDTPISHPISIPTLIPGIDTTQITLKYDQSRENDTYTIDEAKTLVQGPPSANSPTVSRAKPRPLPKRFWYAIGLVLTTSVTAAILLALNLYNFDKAGILLLHNQKTVPDQIDAPPLEHHTLSRELEIATETFTQNKGALKACFEANGIAEAQAPKQISVLLNVMATGQVSAAELIPNAMMHTPLGDCILSIALETTFAKRDEGIIFLIPLTPQSD